MRGMAWVALLGLAAVVGGGCGSADAPGVGSVTTADPFAVTAAASSASTALVDRDLGGLEPCTRVRSYVPAGVAVTTAMAYDQFRCLVEAVGRGERAAVVSVDARGDGGVFVATMVAADAATVTSRGYAVEPDGTVREISAQVCELDPADRYGEPLGRCRSL